MSIENLINFVPEDKKDDFKEAVAAYLDEEVNGIKTNREKIKKEKMKVQDLLREYEPKVSEYDKLIDGGVINEYNRLKEAEKRRQLSQSGSDTTKDRNEDYIDLQMKLNALKTENERLNKSFEVEKEKGSRFSTMLVEKEKKIALRSALDANNFDPEYSDILMKAHIGNTDAKIDDSKVTVYMRSEDGDEISVGDYFKSWSETNQAKKFQKVSIVSGAGATGGTHNGVKSISDLNLDERTKLFQENPSLYKSLTQ